MQEEVGKRNVFLALKNRHNTASDNSRHHPCRTYGRKQ